MINVCELCAATDGEDDSNEISDIYFLQYFCGYQLIL